MAGDYGIRPDHHALLLAAVCRGLSSGERITLLQAVPRGDELRSITSRDVEMIIRRPLSAGSWIIEKLERRAEVAAWWLHSGTARHLLWVGDQEYPESLRHVYDPPAVLFAHGLLQSCAAPRIAVVGTRRPDSQGIAAALEVGAVLAAAGVTVVSGLARGIDGAVHRGVLACAAERRGSRGPGAAVAVLGCGIDRMYPAEHRDLAMDIVACGGLLLSEYPPGTPPQKYQFPARNRIVVGLSAALVLVQAPNPSGALISAEFAMSEGRDVLVHRAGALWEGGARLLNDGAVLVEDGAGILAETDPGSSPPEATVERMMQRMQEQKLALFAAAPQTPREGP